MPRVWKIKKYDGDSLEHEWSVSGALSETEIHKMLQRLISGNLSDTEIIYASLRKNDRNFVGHLKPFGTGNPIHYGAGIYYFTAEFEDN